MDTTDRKIVWLTVLCVFCSVAVALSLGHGHPVKEFVFAIVIPVLTFWISK